jgi:hypothetical protein
LDPGFQRAVAVARRIIEDGLHDEEVAKARVALDVGAVSAVLRKEPVRVIGLSQGKPELFEHLRLAVADAVGRRESLPPEVTAWLVRYLRNEVNPPTGAAGRGPNERPQALDPDRDQPRRGNGPLPHPDAER